MVNGMGVTQAKPVGIPGKRNCASLQLEILPERIHFLKFILEGYDGLGLLSTVDSRQGLVEIRYPPEIEDELLELLRNIEPQIAKNTV